jgi:TBC1 domain family member 6
MSFDPEPAKAMDHSTILRNTRYYPAHEIPQQFSHPSSPGTPISMNTDAASFRSARSSYTSTQPHTLDTSPMPHAGENTSSKPVPFPSLHPSHDSTSPYALPRKKDSSRLRVHVAARNPPRSSDNSPVSPSPSPRSTHFTSTASPLLPPTRYVPPQSPLSVFAPRTSSLAPDSFPKIDASQTYTESEPYAQTPITWNRPRGYTAGSTVHGPTIDPSLKSTSSIHDLNSPTGSRTNISSTYRPDRAPISREQSMSFRREPPLPWMDNKESRGSVRSVRSAWTNASAMTYESSLPADASETERSSINSSYEVFPKLPDSSPKEEPMTVEDVMDMYYGFDIDDDLETRPTTSIGTVDVFADSGTTLAEDDFRAMPPRSIKSVESTLDLTDSSRELKDSVLSTNIISSGLPNEPVSPILDTSSTDGDKPSIPRQQSVSPLSAAESPNPDISRTTPTSTIQSPLRLHPVPKEQSPLPAVPSLPSSPTAPPPPPHQSHIEDKSDAFMPVPRDRYGFKKETREITVDQYDGWNEKYTEYLERRRTKWEVLMQQYRLDTEQPLRFPPKSDKVKRYVRKGIPPEWRGAAWFWYAGGPDRLSKEPGLYRGLVDKALNGELSDTDREMIERDLHRTFPDSMKFRPDPMEQSPFMSALPGRDIRPQGSPAKGEPRIISSLRRVLQAFAIHNPSIGYCQSLNFLAGLLLLMLDEDEEKAFILLEVITSVHFPGIHAKILEANVDIGVLMMCIQESMPAVWNKINDVVEPSQSGRPTTSRGRNAPIGSRLPTVHLAMTPWFMSCFINILPIESVLRVWDTLFYEGSKTVFRIGLAVFKHGEQEIRAIREPLEVFQVIQTIPRRILDINGLMESCFKRRNGFGHVSQETIEERRSERRGLARREQREREHERRILERGRERGMTIDVRKHAANGTLSTTAIPTVDTPNSPFPPPMPPIPHHASTFATMTSSRNPSRERSRPPTRESGDERPGRLRAAAAKLRQQSRSRKRAEKNQ